MLAPFDWQISGWLEEQAATSVFHGMRLCDLVDPDSLSPSVAEGGWPEIVRHIRDSDGVLRETGADWLIYIAAAHVLGPIMVFHAGGQRAIRFDASDGDASGEAADLYSPSLLPAGSETWTRIGLLGNGYFVRLRTKMLQGEILLSMLEDRDRKLEALKVEVEDAIIFLGPSKVRSDPGRVEPYRLVLCAIFNHPCPLPIVIAGRQVHDYECSFRQDAVRQHAASARHRGPFAPGPWQTSGRLQDWQGRRIRDGCCELVHNRHGRKEMPQSPTARHAWHVRVTRTQDGGGQLRLDRQGHAAVQDAARRHNGHGKCPPGNSR